MGNGCNIWMKMSSVDSFSFITFYVFHAYYSYYTHVIALLGFFITWKRLGLDYSYHIYWSILIYILSQGAVLQQEQYVYVYFFMLHSKNRIRHLIGEKGERGKWVYCNLAKLFNSLLCTIFMRCLDLWFPKLFSQDCYFQVIIHAFRGFLFTFKNIMSFRSNKFR